MMEPLGFHSVEYFLMLLLLVLSVFIILCEPVRWLFPGNNFNMSGNSIDDLDVTTRCL